jgi:hypothetical protein
LPVLLALLVVMVSEASEVNGDYREMLARKENAASKVSEAKSGNVVNPALEEQQASAVKKVKKAFRVLLVLLGFKD